MEAEFLQDVALTTVLVSIKSVTTLLSKGLQMTHLSLIDVMLANCFNGISMHLLSRIKERKAMKEGAPIAVTLTDIRLLGYHGRFSASDADITASVEAEAGGLESDFSVTADSSYIRINGNYDD